MFNQPEQNFDDLPEMHLIALALLKAARDEIAASPINGR